MVRTGLLAGKTTLGGPKTGLLAGSTTLGGPDRFAGGIDHSRWSEDRIPGGIDHLGGLETSRVGDFAIATRCNSFDVRLASQNLAAIIGQ